MRIQLATRLLRTSSTLGVRRFWGFRTHKPLNRKMNVKPSFRALLNCSLHITGRGITIKATSDAMFGTEIQRDQSIRSMHVPSLIDMSHIFCKGTHLGTGQLGHVAERKLQRTERGQRKRHVKRSRPRIRLQSTRLSSCSFRGRLSSCSFRRKGD